MQRVRLRRTALRATPRMNTSTQPPEGAGGSRSRATGELTLGLLSGEERKAYPFHCGSWLACEGGLTADQSLADAHHSPVGASLLAMAVYLPTNLLQMPTIPLWERACSRWRSICQPISCRCPPFPCGSELARDGGLSADQSLADAHHSPVGASLLAMAVYLPTNLSRLTQSPYELPQVRAGFGRSLDLCCYQEAHGPFEGCPLPHALLECRSGGEHHRCCIRPAARAPRRMG
jgi:hypothetical protein